MKIAIAFHSTTGNTKLLVRSAGAYLSGRGHACSLYEVARAEAPLALDEVDLLGLACPTLYFRPSLVMERFVARLPATRATKPAFLLATAGGDPGAHFALLAEQLDHKGYRTLGAHFEAFPDNWPAHRVAVQGLAWAEPWAARLTRALPQTKETAALLWPDLGDVDEGAPGRVERFLDDTVEAAERSLDGRPVVLPHPSQLHKGFRPFALLGRMASPSGLGQAAGITIDRARCTKCGTCLKVCPVGCITREDEKAFPVVGRGCTGCFACFNRCPDGAIAGLGAPSGEGRYRGPTRRARAILRGSAGEQ